MSRRARPWSPLTRLASCVAVAGFVLSACGGGGASTSAPVPPVVVDPPRITRVTVSPAGAVLAPGAAARLTATVLDQNGAEMSGVAVSWSSTSAAVSVAFDGTLTAGADIDSSQIRAQAGGMHSQPIDAMVVRMVAGARLLPDAEVLAEPTPIDAAQTGSPGSRFNARIGGTAPTVGQVLLASGGKALAGRVVSTLPAGTGHDVVLEAVGLADVFEQAKIVSRIDASSLPVQFPSGNPTSEKTLPNGSIERHFRLDLAAFTAPAIATASRRGVAAAGHARPEAGRRFSSGPLRCEAEGTVAPSFQASSIDVTPTGSFGIVETTFIVDGGAAYAKVLAEGYFGVQIAGSVRLSGQLDGSLDCKATLISLPIPVPPQIALIVHPVLPVGFKFAAAGQINSPALDLKLDSSVKQPIKAGFELGADGTLTNLSELDRTQLESTFAWNLDADTAAPRFRLEADARAGLFADVCLTSPLLEAAARVLDFSPNLPLVEGFAGFRATSRLQSVAAQLAAPAAPSQYRVDFVASMATSASVDKALALLGSLVGATGFDNTQVAWEPTIMQSPTGAGLASLRAFHTGDPVRFDVVMNADTLKASLLGVDLLPYNIKRVEVWRKAGDGSASRVATRDAAAGEASFTLKWPADADGALNNSYYAMVVPVFGDAFPLLLGEMRGWDGVRQAGANARDEARGFGFDDLGRIYIAATSSSQFSYADPGTGAPTSLPVFGGYDTQVLRYNPLGTVTGGLSFGGSGDDVPIRMKRGPNGALYAIGTTAFGSLTGVPSGSIFSAWIAKVDVSGIQPKLEWRRQIGGRNEYGFGMDIAADGSIYTVSSIAGASADVGGTAFGQTCGDSQTGNGSVDAADDCGDTVVTRLTPDGDVVWRSTASRPGWQREPSIAVRGNTVIVMSATFCEIEDASVADATRGPCVDNKWLDPASNTIYALPMIGLSRVDPSSGAYTHLRSIRSLAGGAAASMSGFTLVVSDAGTPIIGGLRQNTGPGFESGAIPSQYFLAGFDARGFEQWSKVYAGTGRPAASGLVRAGDADYYATFGTFASLYGSNAGGSDAVVVKIGQDGSERWGMQYGSPGDERPNGIDLDVYGNVFVYGATTGGWGPGLSAGFGDRDLFVLKLSPRGQIQGAPPGRARVAAARSSPALPLLH